MTTGKSSLFDQYDFNSEEKLGVTVNDVIMVVVSVVLGNSFLSTTNYIILTDMALL